MKTESKQKILADALKKNLLKRKKQQRQRLEAPLVLPSLKDCELEKAIELPDIVMPSKNDCFSSFNSIINFSSENIISANTKTQWQKKRKH